MLERKTGMAPPALVGLPLPAPVPAAGCTVCAALFNQWRAYSTVGSPEHDPSKATDWAIEIRNHPHTTPKLKLR